MRPPPPKPNRLPPMAKFSRPSDRKPAPATQARRLIKARQHHVLTLYARGKTPEEIAVLTGAHVNHVRRDIATATNALIKDWAQPTAQQTFVRYAAFQLDIVRRLQKACEQFAKDERNKQYSAMVSALRAQSDIYDKVMSKGAELGVIQRSTAGSHIRLQGKDLRHELKTEISKLNKLLTEIDDATQQASVRQTTTSRSTVTFVTRLRKPIVDDYGVVRTIPDWKYRTRVYGPSGEEIPNYQLGPDQQGLLPQPDPDRELRLQFLRERNVPFAELDDGTIILTRTEEQTTTRTVLPDRHTIVEEREPTVVEEDTSWLVRPSRK